MGRGNEHRDRRRQFDAQSVDLWSDYAPPPSYEQPVRQQANSWTSGSEVAARVKWFNPQKGFGFVELTDGSGEAFLHIRQVEAAGYTALEPGTTLGVKVGPGQKGTQVNEVVSVDPSTAAPEPPRRGLQGRSGAPRSGGGSPTTTGIVKWFNADKGYGFVSVEGESKDLFLHISVVERARLGAVTEGQVVRVSIAEGRKGREREVGAIEAA
ncbi:cold-shock protein [Microvirga guangxiensis]|uniref:Cold shock protein (Beta-ribbon, CspA family) n=1 Tax=Microvirga guangxiensis TaxID=549386 RepID=A0A1G5KDJ9_9HYPH|nr:cold-shock protein [Microvirga guangxiensis]SCY98646.1 cold shock protein (beta-ribbon, CspA family) [Microvirga guangxiensis]